MCSGVVPQHPPTMPTPKRSTNSPRVSASSAGDSGNTVSPSEPWIGRPAFGMQCTGIGACSPRKRIASRMSPGPVEQFRPMTSTRSASSVVSAASTSVPRSIVPLAGSSETDTWIGTARPAAAIARRAPNTAALASRMSWTVSMISRSTPPSSSAPACSAKTSASAAGETAPSVGSAEAGSSPVGPMQPATKRSSPAASRARRAAATLISCVRSSRPHSASFRRLAWNVLVSSDLGAGVDHRGVDVADDVGAAEVQHLVRAAGQAVVVLEGEIEGLEGGAHAAVEDHDALAGGLEEVASHGGGR